MPPFLALHLVHCLDIPVISSSLLHEIKEAAFSPAEISFHKPKDRRLHVPDDLRGGGQFLSRAPPRYIIYDTFLHVHAKRVMTFHGPVNN